jgi:thermitase
VSKRDEDLSTDEVERLATTAGGYIPPRAEYLAGADGVAMCPRFIPGEDNPGPMPIFYRRDELVVPREFAGAVAEVLPRLGGGQIEDRDTGKARAVMFRVASDSLTVARELKRLAKKGKAGLPTDLVAGPHHVLTLTPKPKIGPGSDPIPTGAKWEPGDKAAGESISLAVVDTGMWKEPDAPGLEPEQRSGDEDPIDVLPATGVIDWYGGAHGGFIAGIIRSRVGNLPISVENAFGDDGLTELSVVAQVDEVIGEYEMLVLNLSLGSYKDEQFGTDLVFLADAMERWAKSDTLIVAAAGNDGVRQKFYPAAFAAQRRYADCVVSVGALEDTGALGPGIRSRPADFSNYGRWVTAWAPGVDVVSQYPRDLRFLYHDPTGPAGTAAFPSGTARWSGTSFAAPFAAAEIARYAAERGVSPKEAWAQIRSGRPFVVFSP